MRDNMLLVDAFDRLPELIAGAVDGLTPEQLTWSPAKGANSIGWLVWHLTRVQDHHVADLLGESQVWASGDWSRRFGLAPDPDNTGYGHDIEDIATVRPESADALTDYYRAVARRTRTVLDEIAPTDLDRIVDDSWDPPVTLGIRLMSVLQDDLQHIGQAAYLRGWQCGTA